VTFLLDVNVLIALADSGHSHHSKAAAWFAEVGQADWASCPITENGMIRILSDPRYGTPAPDTALVAELLQLLRLSGNHSFWQENISLIDPEIFVREKLPRNMSRISIFLGLPKLTAVTLQRLTAVFRHRPSSAGRTSFM
jgi:hypothetical protein